MTNWKTIESAPRDGRVILLFTPDYDGLLIQRFGAGEWDGDGSGGGFWLHEMYGEPTHWMPLPPPPSETE